MNLDSSAHSGKSTKREYKCPCGKDYLSYPALFTHIKQKHDGKAPGNISKPKLESKPRGRPPRVAEKNFARTNDRNGQASRQTATSYKPTECDQNSQIYWFNFQTIFIKLRQIIFPEKINQTIWDEVSSFRRFEHFIDISQESDTIKFQKITIGMGLCQFLKEVSVKTESWRFEQVLILFILLLQYILDQNNDTTMIESAPVQILIEYMNPFINYHISDYAEYLGINSLWIMQKESIHNIFICFYNWLKWKNYTDFCITLID